MRTANGVEFACIAAAWQAHHAELMGDRTHRLSVAATADDVLHDVFVKAICHTVGQGQGFCALDTPRAWLCQAARNTLVDRAQVAHPAEPLPEGADERAAPEQKTPAPVDELANGVSGCLDELTDEDAAILRACDLDGQTTWTFAGTHALPLAAAKSRLLRAR